jgi:hypothetical protein
MKNKTRKTTSRREILKKYQHLENVKEKLKAEFVGIDKVIDSIVESISSWYLFPNLQENPFIINLWGLTGVGKSSLARRLIQLIKFDTRSYEFDLGENSESNTIKHSFEDISDELMGKPMVLTFDEFQYARTIGSMGEEIDNSFSRIIWQLFDNGRSHSSKFNLTTSTIYEHLHDLDYLIRLGVKVREGMVVDNKEVYHNYQNKGYNRNRKSYDPQQEFDFIDPAYYDDFMEVAPDQFPHLYSVEQALKKLDGPGSIRFLEGMLELSLKPKLIDCSKALIFVMGNLDEAYRMSADYNPDMEADEFHEQSLKISVVDIKKALRHRFRNEQIARLGNIHIIYPAFSRDSFYKIINLELDTLKEDLYRKQKLKISFDNTIHELIYKEGVFPAQGTRPVYSTIHNLIKTRLGKIASEAFLKEITDSNILIKAEEGKKAR